VKNFFRDEKIDEKMAEINEEMAEILKATVMRNDSGQIHENDLVSCQCDGMFILNKMSFINFIFISCFPVSHK